MSRDIFHVDAYTRRIDAAVIDVRDDGVILDRTVFFPGGGGQPHDLGRLAWPGGEAEVVVVARAGEWVVHRLEGVAPEIGVTVTQALDWERRYALMRTHTALHVLCGVVWRDWGAQVTGGNMQPLSGRLDFEFESLTGDLVAEIETRLNVEVEAARSVRVGFLTRAEAETVPDLIRTKINLLPKHLTEIRTIEIEGLDLQADGGTHVANTSEVGTIRIARYKSKGRINKRIEIELEPGG